MFQPECYIQHETSNMINEDHDNGENQDNVMEIIKEETDIKEEMLEDFGVLAGENKSISKFDLYSEIEEDPLQLTTENNTERKRTLKEVKKCRKDQVPVKETENNTESHNLSELQNINKNLFKCGHCSFQTSEKRILQIHLMSHKGEKSFKCSYCSFQASADIFLELHEKSHVLRKIFICKFCPYESKKHDLVKLHSVSHNSKHVFESHTYDILKTHLRLHEPKIENNIESSQTLEREFQSQPLLIDTNNENTSTQTSLQNSLKMHLTKHMEEESVPSSLQSKISEKQFDEGAETIDLFDFSQCLNQKSSKHAAVEKYSNTDAEKTSQKCAYCSYQTTNDRALEIHLKTTHYNCEMPLSLQMRFKKLEKQFDEGAETIDLLDFSQSLIQRSSKHAAVEKYSNAGVEKTFRKCAYCSYQTTGDRALEIHLKTTHYNCEVPLSLRMRFKKLTKLKKLERQSFLLNRHYNIQHQLEAELLIKYQNHRKKMLSSV